MPLTTAYLDSYNTSIDRINTCIMSAVFSPDNTRLIASDDQGRLGLFYSSPQISSKPIFLTTLTNTHHSQTNSTLNNNNNSISLASSANEVLIVVGGSSHNGLVQGYRWSDIISNKKNTQLPSDIFSFDLARGPNEIFVCVQAPSKKQQQKPDEIIVGSSIGILRVLNIERQTLVTTIDAAHKGTIHQVAFANDGKRVASCSEDGKFTVLNRLLFCPINEKCLQNRIGKQHYYFHASIF
jgi:WD40 repeat protein